MPGLSCTVEEQIEALRLVAGNEVVKLIEFKPDEKIIEIVKGWPQNFKAQKAKELGFYARRLLRKLFRFY